MTLTSIEQRRLEYIEGLEDIEHAAEVYATVRADLDSHKEEHGCASWAECWLGDEYRVSEGEAYRNLRAAVGMEPERKGE